MSFKKINSFNLVWLLLTLSSVISGILIFIDSDKPESYLVLPLLPFSFGLINMIFVTLYSNITKNIGLTLVIGLYYLRFVIVPIIMSLGGYTTHLNLNISQNMPNAIALAIYELILVYMAIYWTIYKGTILQNQIYITDKYRNGQKKLKMFSFALVGILIFDLFVFILIPESRQLYSNLFTTLNKTDAEILGIHNFAERGNIKRVFLTLYSMSMEIVRVLVPAYLIILVRKKFGERLQAIILSIPLVLLQFALVSNTHARSVLCAVVLMLLIAKLYPTWSTKLYKSSLIFGFLFVVWYFTYKSGVANVSYSGASTMAGRASEISNAYFSGPDNIAAIFNVKTEEKWSPLLYTLISAIPFNGTLIGMDGYNYSTIYNLYNQSQFQIGPLIGESYFYLGAIFSPIPSVIIASLAIHYGRKARLETNLWKYVANTYFTIILSTSLILYGGTIFLKTFGSLIVPMLILTYFSNSKKSDIRSLKSH